MKNIRGVSRLLPSLNGCWTRHRDMAIKELASFWTGGISAKQILIIWMPAIWMDLAFAEKQSKENNIYHNESRRAAERTNFETKLKKMYRYLSENVGKEPKLHKIYTSLVDEMKTMDKKPNDMAVPAAIRELEKIKMVRQTDHVYRLNHAVTATQKKILKAFGLTENYIKYAGKQDSKGTGKCNKNKSKI